MTWYPWTGGPTTLASFQGFYDFYAVNRTHPFIFMETSADGWGDPAVEETLKTNQVTYLYNATTLSAYPYIKGIVWFNVVKGEQMTPTNQALVTKNFLIPDGQWNNHGQSTTLAGMCTRPRTSPGPCSPSTRRRWPIPTSFPHRLLPVRGS